MYHTALPHNDIVYRDGCLGLSQQTRSGNVEPVTYVVGAYESSW